MDGHDTAAFGVMSNDAAGEVAEDVLRRTHEMQERVSALAGRTQQLAKDVAELQDKIDKHARRRGIVR